jgi:hypothetical protein
VIYLENGDTREPQAQSQKTFIPKRTNGAQWPLSRPFPRLSAALLSAGAVAEGASVVVEEAVSVLSGVGLASTSLLTLLGVCVDSNQGCAIVPVCGRIVDAFFSTRTDLGQSSSIRSRWVTIQLLAGL